MCISEIFSKYFNSSFTSKILNIIDVSGNSQIVKALNESFLFKLLNRFFAFIQNVFEEVSTTSIFVKNIDNIILFLITLLMGSIIVAPTGIIGLLAFACILLTILKLCLIKGEKLSVNSIDTAILLYIAIIGLSVAYSYMPFAAAKGFAKMLIYFGLYLTFFNIIKTHPKRTLYILGIVASFAMIESFYAIYQQIHGVDALASWQDLSKANPEQLMNRVYGTLIPFNPNLLAGYLIASFSSVAGMFFYFLTQKNKKMSLAFGIGTLAVLFAIICTGSRGAFIAIAGMMIFIMAISGHILWNDYSDRKQLKTIWIGIITSGIVLAILAIAASPALQHRIASIFAARSDSSNSFRMNVWISTLKMFADNWFIGIGTGNTVFRQTYGFYMVTGFDALGAYCVPLEIAAESGIFALMAFGWLLFMIFVKGVKTIHSSASIEQKIIISICIVGILGIMLHGLVDTIYYRPQINAIFWMLVAVFAANMPKNISRS